MQFSAWRRSCTESATKFSDFFPPWREADFAFKIEKWHFWYFINVTNTHLSLLLKFLKYVFQDCHWIGWVLISNFLSLNFVTWAVTFFFLLYCYVQESAIILSKRHFVLILLSLIFLTFLLGISLKGKCFSSTHKT